MTRSDLFVNLVKANSQGDQAAFRRTLEAIIAEERAKQHHILADRLAHFLNDNGYPKNRVNGISNQQVANFIYEITPQRALKDLILPDVVLEDCRELIEEHQRKELLRSYNIEPRHRVLLVGPPGNGKTSLAEALAFELMLPMFVIRYEGVIGSYLGETANRVRTLLDYIRIHQCILFLDEFDTLAKERGDIHETGEIKRVVSSLLLQLDSLPSHVLVITATNHPELLDRAVWRRFQLRLTLPRPSKSMIEKWFQSFQERINEPLGYTPGFMAKEFVGNSYAELEEFCNDICRRRILTVSSVSLQHNVDVKLKQWALRAKPQKLS